MSWPGQLEMTDEEVRRSWEQSPRYIYGLVDPRTDQVRYIGKSIRPLERLRNHINEKGRCHRTNWLQELKREGLEPYLVLFEMHQGAAPWQEAERFWIARGRALGWPLTNNTSGGDGVPDLPPEARERMRRTWLGRKHSPETLAKLKARTGRKASVETRAKMSTSQTGRKITWIGKIAERLRKLTPEQVEAIKQRVAAGEKVKDLAAEYGVHRVTISKVNMGTYFLPYRRKTTHPAANHAAPEEQASGQET